MRVSEPGWCLVLLLWEYLLGFLFEEARLSLMFVFCWPHQPAWGQGQGGFCIHNGTFSAESVLCIFSHYMHPLRSGPRYCSQGPSVVATAH